MTDLKRTAEEVLELDGKATPEPWLYRPHKHDDWGWLRGPDAGNGEWSVAQAMAGRQVEMSEADECRRTGTDPYGANATLISHYRTSAVALARAYLAAVERLEEVERELAAIDAAAVALFDCPPKYSYVASKMHEGTIEAARARLARQQGERK